MKFTKIKAGETLSTTMYLEVLGKTTKGIEVKDALGQKFTVNGSQLIEATMNSADQFDKEEKISKTEMAAILTNAGDAAFTVVFDKADGSERTLTGRLVDTENHMGRSNVIDLKITDGKSPLRQVDHRTLKSLVYKGTKYTAKK